MTLEAPDQATESMLPDAAMPELISAQTDALGMPDVETTEETTTEPRGKVNRKPNRMEAVQPVLEKLFELYPHLFGAEFLPLKLGVFQELLAAHPEHFQRDSLKAALGVHTRSGRYLQSVASGKPRYDLQGVPGDAVAVEHVYLSLLELFRRRQARAREDLRPRFRAQLIAAVEASGLTRQEYLLKVQTKDDEATELLQEALAELDDKLAKQEALVRTYEASGKTVEEFADMYGMNPQDVHAALAHQSSKHSTLTA